MEQSPADWLLRRAVKFVAIAVVGTIALFVVMIALVVFMVKIHEEYQTKTNALFTSCIERGGTMTEGPLFYTCVGTTKSPYVGKKPIPDALKP